ncbi:hypothetical protein XA68_14279 [Ophiocordyceps unilateralis]|uniref:Uncharacterized protein n=1 Tax=Ophiocordyceps unilateralis TaxID=268505 RepID=A0A2A9PM40_OPHUN|nr:hypothetical protein XA68_14279 [Ophiocordyceps unilateralis]
MVLSARPYGPSHPSLNPFLTAPPPPFSSAYKRLPNATSNHHNKPSSVATCPATYRTISALSSQPEGTTT